MDSHKILLIATTCILLFFSVGATKKNANTFQTELPASRTSHTSWTNDEAGDSSESILKLRLTKEEWKILTEEVIAELRAIVKASAGDARLDENRSRTMKGVRPIVAENINVREIAYNILGIFGDSVQSKKMQSYLLSENFARDVFEFIQADIRMPNERI